MGSIAQALRATLGVIAFFAMVYLAYLCTYFGPTVRLRRWGVTTSWLLTLRGHGLLATGDRN